jgi:HK97 family phage major capsid protein
MNKIEELIKLINVRMAELDGLKQRVSSENRHPNDEEITKTDSLLQEVISLRKELDVEKREAEVRAELSRGLNDRVVRPYIESNEDEKMKRFGEMMPPKEKRFSSIGEQLLAIRASKSGSSRDSRLGWIEDQLRAAGMTEGVPTDGGFLVQTDFATTLLEKVYESNPILPRVTKITLGGNYNAIDLPMVNETTRVSSIWGGIIMYWKSEGELKSESAPQFKKISLKLKKVTGLAYGSDELIDDAAIVTQLLERGFTEGLDVEMERVIIRGSGAGQPQGILNSGSLITVDKETGQVAPDLVMAENIVKMYARMHTRGIKNSVWLISQSVLPYLFFLTMPGIPTIPLYMPPGGLANAPYSTLLGRPIFQIENCSAVGTVGDIIFADFSQYALIDKGGPKTAWSPHVRFIYDEGTYRMVYRTDGQSIWAAPLTPKDDSGTVSPFIVLESR